MADLTFNNNYSVATGTNTTSPFVTHFQTRDPTSQDVNYPLQKEWFNTTNNNLWILVGFITIAGVITADWRNITSGLTNTETLTGNSGGPVGVDASNNINTLGDGTTINVVGSPGTNTLTWSTVNGFAITFITVANSPYTVLTTDQYIAVDCSGGAVTLRLPNAPFTTRVIYIKDQKGSSSTNHITITTVGGAVNIDGATSQTLASNYASASLIFDGTAYEVF